MRDVERALLLELVAASDRLAAAWLAKSTVPTRDAVLAVQTLGIRAKLLLQASGSESPDDVARGDVARGDK